MRPQIHLSARAAAFVVACLFCVHAFAADSAQPVRTALTGLDAFLGQGANAAAWDKYLNLAGLRAEVDKGDKADRAVLASVDKQLASGVAGLELPAFAKLRDAVSAWNAELAISQAPNLSDAVLAATFTPVSDPQLAAAKATLQAAAGKLDKYLSGANGAAWKKYLQSDELQAQLKADKPDLAVLKGVEAKFVADKAGLELPVYRNVGDALTAYLTKLAARQESAPAEFGEQLKALAELLKKHGESPTEATGDELGQRLGWLADRGQAPAMVKAVRAKFARPNVHARVSARLAGAGIAQDVDEATPVSDYILGTSIRGSGRTKGKVHLELVPSEQRAMFDTLLSATVQTRSVGQNGPATIYTNGNTALAARKRVVFDANGFASYPATAAANTLTQVTGIGGSGIVQRVANKRIGEQKPQAERIASDHAADRLRVRMEQQVGEQLSKAHDGYLKNVRHPLTRVREFPELSLKTTDKELLVQALQANAGQVSASSIAPEIKVDNDLSVQLHESAANNLAQSMLGGATIHEEEMQKKIIEIRGELPEKMKAEQDRDPWTITFAKVKPVTVKFTKDGLQVTVRGEKYVSGDGKPWGAMNITADYKYEVAGPGLKLTRVGDLKIVPPNFDPEKAKLSVRQIALREKLEKRFNSIFEPEVVYEGLILPGKWRNAGRLDIKQAESNDGWIALAWIESGVPAPPEKPKAAPAPAPAKPVDKQAARTAPATHTPVAYTPNRAVGGTGTLPSLR